jgi:hypothetical protein
MRCYGATQDSPGMHAARAQSDGAGRAWCESNPARTSVRSGAARDEPPRLHGLAPVRFSCAHAQRLGALLQAQLKMPCQGAAHALDCVAVDDHTAVDLPEDGRVKALDEFFEWRRDQRFAFGRDDRDVLVVGSEVADVFDRDETRRRGRAKQ